ncbi:hypothetical protein [Kingella oralis]
MCDSTAHHIIKHRQTVHGKAARPPERLPSCFQAAPPPPPKKRQPENA